MFFSDAKFKHDPVDFERAKRGINFADSMKRMDNDKLIPFTFQLAQKTAVF